MKFVDKQIAIKLKEKGFNKPCFGEYRHGHDNFIPFLTDGDKSFEELLQYSWFIPAPTIEQVLEWLREEKDIHIGIGYTKRRKYNWVICFIKDDDFPSNLNDHYFDTYDDACIAGIEYVINNLI